MFRKLRQEEAAEYEATLTVMMGNTRRFDEAEIAFMRHCVFWLAKYQVAREDWDDMLDLIESSGVDGANDREVIHLRASIMGRDVIPEWTPKPKPYKGPMGVSWSWGGEDE